MEVGKRRKHLIKLAEKFQYICHWCKHKYKIEELSRDHLTRLRQIKLDGKSKAKRYRTTGGKDNIVLSCKLCNLSRN